MSVQDLRLTGKFFRATKDSFERLELDRETQSLDPESAGVGGDVSPSNPKQGLTLPSPQPRALGRRAAQRVRAI